MKTVDMSSTLPFLLWQLGSTPKIITDPHTPAQNPAVQGPVLKAFSGCCYFCYMGVCILHYPALLSPSLSHLSQHSKEFNKVFPLIFSPVRYSGLKNSPVFCTISNDNIGLFID